MWNGRMQILVGLNLEGEWLIEGNGTELGREVEEVGVVWRGIVNDGVDEGVSKR